MHKLKVYATKEPQANSLCYEKECLIREPLVILKLSELLFVQDLRIFHDNLPITHCSRGFWGKSAEIPKQKHPDCKGAA